MNNNEKSMIALEVEIPEPLFRAITDHVDCNKVDFNHVFEKAITLWLNTRNLTAVIATLEDQFKL